MSGGITTCSSATSATENPRVNTTGSFIRLLLLPVFTEPGSEQDALPLLSSIIDTHHGQRAAELVRNTVEQRRAQDARKDACVTLSVHGDRRFSLRNQ
jgi:hypothetical protein